jgi:MFS family permease
MLVMFAIVFGVCYGSCVALLLTIVMDLYGPRAVSGIIGCLYTGAGIGTLLGPWLAGVAYDTVGSYQLAILAGAVFSAGAAACVVILLYGGQAKAFDRG